MTPIKPTGPIIRPNEYKNTAYYGSAQEHYNVEHNSVWKAGDNTLICGDLLHVATTGLLWKNIPTVDVIYTDPPWTPSIYAQFYRNAELPAPETPFDVFIHHSIDIFKRLNPSGIIFVESGKGSKDLIISCLESSGAHTLSIIDCTYTKRKTTYILWVGSYNHTVTIPEKLMTVGHHENQVVLSIAHSTAKPGIKFMDPLCGQMTFITPAATRGATVYGVELIPRKFAEGLRTISRVIGQPTRIV